MTIAIGDKVEVMFSKEELRNQNFYEGSLTKGDVGVVTGLKGMSVKLNNEGTCCWIKTSSVSAALDYPNPPHKHAALIKAWADGALIQLGCAYGPSWKDVRCPDWSARLYRIKPTKTDKEVKLEALEIKAQELADEIKELRNA